MKKPLQVSLIAAALCIGGVILHLLRGDDPAPPAAPPDDAWAVAAAAAPVSTREERRSTPERVAAGTAPAPEPWLAHPYEVAIELLVVDPLGLPVEGFRPELAPPGGTLREAPDVTDASGRVVVKWPARVPQVAVEVLDPRRHRRLVTARTGATTRLTLLHASKQAEVATGGTFLLSHMVETVQAPNALATVMRSARLQPGLHPHAVFSEGGLVLPEREASGDRDEVALTFTVADMDRVVEGVFFDSGGFVVDGENQQHQQQPAANATLDGIVFGEDGRPARDLPVALLGSGPQPLRRTTSDGEGRFRFENLAPKDVTVRAGGTDQGLATTTLRIVGGACRTMLQLRRDACIRGALRDPDGAPLADAIVEWQADDGSWVDEAKTGADGAFLFANVPAVSGRLVAWPKGGERRLPILCEPGVRADSAYVALVGDPDGGAAVQLMPTAPDGIDASGLRARLRQLSTGFSRAIERPKLQEGFVDASGSKRTRSHNAPDQPWRIDGLPAGAYEVELWCAGCGHVSLGRHWLDGDGTLDLGVAPLPVPGAVRFELAAGDLPNDLAAEIVAVRRDFDVRIEALERLDVGARLASGDYVFVWRRGEGPLHAERFAVQRGEVTPLRAAF